MIRICSISLLVVLAAHFTTPASALTLEETCGKVPQDPDEKNGFKHLVATGWDIVARALDDLDSDKPKHQCSLVRWSKPEADEHPTIIVVVNRDDQVSLSDVILRVRSAGPIEKDPESLPVQIGPNDDGVFLYAEKVRALELEAKREDIVYLSELIEVPEDGCEKKTHSFEDAITELKANAASKAAKYNVMADLDVDEVRVIMVRLTKKSFKRELLDIPNGRGRAYGILCV